MSPPDRQIHATISGPIVMIGFGSIGKGTLPLIERHFDYDKSRFVIIDPHEDGELAKQHGVRFIKQAITRDNYREVLVPLLTAGGGQGFCVNLSVDTSSVDIMTLCREIGSLYIDTVVEPWLGFYFDRSAGPEARSNYALARDAAGGQAQEPGRPDRGFRPAAPIPAWCRGSSSRRCSISPATPERPSTTRRAGRAGASSPASLASRVSISPSATPSARRSRSR